jgi:hypothetical protein
MYTHAPLLAGAEHFEGATKKNYEKKRRQEIGFKVSIVRYCKRLICCIFGVPQTKKEYLNYKDLKKKKKREQNQIAQVCSAF